MTTRKPIAVDAGTRNRQATASDPDASAWVSANAGSGKTHVLSQRVIRLLLNGVEPSKILCLTYTRTAAAEMENRVFQRLSAWTALNDVKLAEVIADIEGKRPGAARLKRARTLFARALETPGGLQIQTIHAFSTALLKRFPLEANIAGHFELLDDETGDLLRREAVRLVLSSARSGGLEALTSAFETALDAGGESGLETLFKEALSGPNRSAISAFLAETAHEDAATFFRLAGLEAGDDAQSVLDRFWPLRSLAEPAMRALADAAISGSGKQIPEFGERLQAVLAAKEPAGRLASLEAAFLKADGQPQSADKYAKPPLIGVLPDLKAQFGAVCSEILAVRDSLSRVKMLDASKAAWRLMHAAQQEYRNQKRAIGTLDYEDLIEAARNLLLRDQAAAWVQYKLDQGIDHVLVDEAQDTSPRQWDLVNALTGDFFSGLGASEKGRTLFVVGDEKQSIYSFQGARPEVFARTGREKQRLARQAEQKFEHVILPLSFRSTPEILKGADLVFEPLRLRGQFSAGGDGVIHEALRKAQHGRIEVWNRITPKDDDEAQSHIEDDWTKAVDHLKAPAAVLAKEMAAVIQSMVSGERNPATGAAVRPGDILVLVRKRGQFVHALARELKDLGVPVAGADRLVLTSHIAVLDLLALARVTLQPEDDLSLAALLKSPVFDLTDDDLVRLSAGREPNVSLLSRLQEAAGHDARLRRVAASLKGWRDAADFVPVYEFFAGILGRDGVRSRLIGRLGEEAADVLDEFLAFALSAEKAGIHGLQHFIEALSASAPEIKREASAGRDEVRIMTVHGAKGLEAPYVFLVDPGSAPAPRQHVPSLFAHHWPDSRHGGPVFFWAPGEASANAVFAEACGNSLEAQAAEYLRLLYVAMTRAEDVLIVCGFGGKREQPGTWQQLVRAALENEAETSVDVHPVTGRDRLVFKLGQTKTAEYEERDAVGQAAVDLPDWLLRPVAPAPLLPRPLTPSSAGLTIEDEAALDNRSPVLQPKTQEPSAAMQRGAAVHRLFEILPALPADERLAAAIRYLKRNPGPIANEAETLAGRVLDILADARLAILFGPGSQAEISIGGTIVLGGEARVISGKIDRIAVSETTVLIADFKTGRRPGREGGFAPHVAQLALYAALLQPLYPAHIVEAVLVYSDGPDVVPIDSSALKQALEGLTAS